MGVVGREGRGGALDMGSAPPPRDKLDPPPWVVSQISPKVSLNTDGEYGPVTRTREL